MQLNAESPKHFYHGKGHTLHLHYRTDIRWVQAGSHREDKRM